MQIFQTESFYLFQPHDWTLNLINNNRPKIPKKYINWIVDGVSNMKISKLNMKMKSALSDLTKNSKPTNPKVPWEKSTNCCWNMAKAIKTKQIKPYIGSVSRLFSSVLSGWFTASLQSLFRPYYPSWEVLPIGLRWFWLSFSFIMFLCRLLWP